MNFFKKHWLTCFSAVCAAALIIFCIIYFSTTHHSVDKKSLITNGPFVNVGGPPYNAKCDGVTDDRIAIQTAIDSVEADQKKILQLPAGRCMLMTPTGGHGVIPLHGQTLRGFDRDSTTLVMSPGSADGTFLIYATAPDITIENLTLDGSKSGQTPGEHRHGIMGNHAPRLKIQHVTSQNFMGDGFYVYTGSDHVTVTDVLGQLNSRNGLTLGGQFDTGDFSDSTFIDNGAQQFDTEPGVGSTAKNIRIWNSTFDGHAVSSQYVLTVGGSSGVDLAKNWDIHGNRINGAIYVCWASDIRIYNNTGTNTTTHSTMLYRTTDHIRIWGNTWTTTAAPAGIEINGTGPGQMTTNALITNNELLIATPGASAGLAISGAISVEFSDNIVRGAGLAVINSAGLKIRATSPVVNFKTMIVRRNHISNFGRAGIFVTGNDLARLQMLDITDNVFDDDSSVSTMTSAMSLNDDEGNAAAHVKVSGNVVMGGVSTLYSRRPPSGAKSVLTGDEWITTEIVTIPFPTVSTTSPITSPVN